MHMKASIKEPFSRKGESFYARPIILCPVKTVNQRLQA